MQTPDERGNTIPLNQTSGQIKWTLRQTRQTDNPKNDKFALIGRSEQIDTANDVASSYACQNCCSGGDVGAFVSTDFNGSRPPGDDYEFEVGDTVQYYAFLIHRDCFGYDDYCRMYPSDWDSSNENIATVNSSGLVTILDVGDVEISTNLDGYLAIGGGPCGPYLTEACENPSNTKAEKFETKTKTQPSSLIPPCGECESHFVNYHPDANIAVAPKVQKIQYRVDGNWLDIPTNGLGPICKGTSITFKAIPASRTWSSNRPIWGGDANGRRGGEVTVAFNNSGTRTISARSSGVTVSVNVAVEQGNSTTNLEWLAPNITTNTQTGDGETTPTNPDIEYNACANIENNTWNLRATSIEASSNIIVPTGGYRDPDLNPPIRQSEARNAVTELNAYYDFGRRSWHKASATEAHEKYHHSELECASKHYWGPTEAAIELLTVQYSSYNSEASAINQLRIMTNGANTKMSNFETIVDDYVATLSDLPPSRPYAAGQIELNGAINRIRELASQNGWFVGNVLHPNPNTSDPCYQAWLPYNP